MASRCASRTPDEPTPLAPGRPSGKDAHLPRRRPEGGPSSRALRRARALGWLGPGLCLALLVLAGPARAAWMIPISPYRAKDFSIVKRDGWYHCFYILRDVSVPYDST